MIKQIIIIILILLLLISLYSYYCLSDSMIKFENNRFDYLNNKNIDLNEKEKGLGSNLHCRNQNEEYEEAYKEIAKIILESKNNKNYIDYKKFIEENQINIEDEKLVVVKNKLGVEMKSITNENDVISELNEQIKKETEKETENKINKNNLINVENSRLNANTTEISNNKDELTETYLKNNLLDETGEEKKTIFNESNKLIQDINNTKVEVDIDIESNPEL